MRGTVLVCLACASLLSMTVAEAQPAISEGSCGKEAWNKFVPDLVTAQSAFVRGDPAQMKALWSHADDVTSWGHGEVTSEGGRRSARDSTGFPRVIPEDKERTTTRRSLRSLDQIWRSSFKSSISRIQVWMAVRRAISA